MRFLLACFVILPFISFGQLNCTIELIDKYSNQEIVITSDFQIERSLFEIDSSQRHIHLHKLRGSDLLLSSSNYELFEKRIKRKSLKNDTLTLWLIPNDSICQIHYNRTWVNHELKMDTVEVSSVNSISSYVQSLLKYLLRDEGKCANALCSYSNTYYFEFSFLQDHGVYQVEEVKRVKHNGYECSFLEDNVLNIDSVLPAFVVAGDVESEKSKIRFSIWINYY